MVTQLNPPLPLDTSRGPGLAHFLIDYGPESHLMWVVFMDKDGACWTVPNPEVRMQPNWSLQRRPARPPAIRASDNPIPTPPVEAPPPDLPEQPPPPVELPPPTTPGGAPPLQMNGFYGRGGPWPGQGAAIRAV